MIRAAEVMNKSYVCDKIRLVRKSTMKIDTGVCSANHKASDSTSTASTHTSLQYYSVTSRCSSPVYGSPSQLMIMSRRVCEWRVHYFTDACVCSARTSAVWLLVDLRCCVSMGRMHEAPIVTLTVR